MDFLQLDSNLFLFLNGIHSPFSDAFMYQYSGKWIWIPMYIALLYTLWYNFKWRMFLLIVLGIALTFALTDQITVSVIRPDVARLRPAQPGNPISHLVHIVNGYRGGRYSFPSAHAANTFGLACFVWLLFRKWWCTLFLMGWATLACYSRISLGVHYPGDLLAGALVGFAAATAVFLIFRKVSKYKPQPTIHRLYVPLCAGGLTIIAISVYAAIETIF
ncbi:MAG: phosphatase PAP2 family protein [Prevotellaceae bacterium]|jgi:undecaprenyl-diphosphatase|nr:phosphatase PAP2 family protein [Prevotellaceae bacterium]